MTLFLLSLITRSLTAVDSRSDRESRLVAFVYCCRSAGVRQWREYLGPSLVALKNVNQYFQSGVLFDTNQTMPGGSLHLHGTCNGLTIIYGLNKLTISTFPVVSSDRSRAAEKATYHFDIMHYLENDNLIKTV